MSTIDTPTLDAGGLVSGSRPRAAGSPNRLAMLARRLISAGLLHVVLTILAVAMFLPFLWMVLTSLKPETEVGLPTWLPTHLSWHNYSDVFGVIPFGRYYWNSIFVASWVTLLQVFTSSLAAFSFARLQWPGRDKVFLLYLATMMLPGLVVMIPNYQIMIQLGLVDSYAGLIIPGSFSVFGTFLLRQFMLTIPRELDEAAEIDGASKWQLYWEIIMPLARPGLITLTIFTFLGSYQSFFWPLVMLKSTHKYTLQIGLLYFDNYQHAQATHLLMAAATMMIVPMIVLFVCLQRYLVKGIQMGAVKG